MRTRRAVLGALFTLVASVSNAGAEGGDAALHGDWAGWAYIEGGGDTPIWLHVRERGGALDVTLDVPPSEAFGLETEEERYEGGALTFARDTSAGRWEARLEVDGGEMRGAIRRGGGAFLELEAFRSPEPLVAMDRARSKDEAGLFRAGDGRTILLNTWFWGDHWVQDQSTGERRCLFPIGEDEYISGSIFGGPSAPVARWKLERGADGALTGLVLGDAGGVGVRAARVRLETEPFEFRSGEATLRGALVTPEGEGPFAGVVLIGGSSWHTREDTMPRAHMFASMGVAALAFDRRGFGESEGEGLDDFARTARDAVCALEAVRSHAKIDAARIGFFGASRGGWQALLAAGQRPDAAFLVQFVAPAVSPEAQETERRLGELRREGATPEELGEARRYLERQFEFGATGRGWDEYVAARGEIVDRGWLGVLDGPETSEDAEWEFVRLNMRLEPMGHIRSLRCPTLVILGGADVVVPRDPSEGLWRAGLAASPAAARSVVHVSPGADHALRLLPADGNAPPLHRALNDAADVWPMVESFLRREGIVRSAGR